MIETRKILIAHAVCCGGEWDRIYEAIRQRDSLSNEEIIRINNELKCKAITIIDEEYPEYLRNSYKPPIVLFYEGDISLIQNRALIQIKEFLPQWFEPDHRY